MNSSWRSGLVLLLFVLAILIGIDQYVSGVLQRQAAEAGFDRLAGLARAGLARPPRANDIPSLQSWTLELAEGGARVSVHASDGRVLAESAAAEEGELRPADRPEFQAARQNGEGRAARRNEGSGAEALHYCVRAPEMPASIGGGPAIVCLAMEPVASSAATDFRRNLWVSAFVLVLLAGGVVVVRSRQTSARIRALEEFARRMAAGDFATFKAERGGGELGELAKALNETSGRMSEMVRGLTEERDRSAAILRSMVEGVAVVNAQERVVFSNRAFSQILELDEMQLEGRPLLEAVRQSDLVAVIKAALGGSEVNGEIVVGTVRPRSFSVTAAPVRAEQPTGAVLVLHDISELRRLERVRRDFVANVSHELRTPLTAIQGFAETLLGGALDDREHRRRFVEIIREHAARLGRLTEDLLKLSRIEAGQLELEFRPTSVYQLVESCLETAQLKATPKGLALETRLPAGLPAVHGDLNGLHEVLQNLLDNAVQYTPAGGRVEVSAAAGDGEVVITVADTGIGIPQAEQARIFERFYRVDAARSREAGGTGLGLSIARHIIEAHGGRLWVESAVGEGARFHFSVPARS